MSRGFQVLAAVACVSPLLGTYLAQLGKRKCERLLRIPFGIHMSMQYFGERHQPRRDLIRGWRGDARRPISQPLKRARNSAKFCTIGSRISVDKFGQALCDSLLLLNGQK